jgi:cytochrome b
MEFLRLRRERVYDPVLRLLHAWNALLVVLLLLSSQVAKQLVFDGEAAALWRIHLWLGYLLFIGLVARFAWGVVGPDHARWAALWQPAAWLDALRQRSFFSVPSGIGHHPQASLIYLIFYGVVWAMAITGLALAAIDQGLGPLYEALGHDYQHKSLFSTPHDWLEELVLAFVAVHLIALVLHERRHGIPLAQGMVSGYQYRKENEQ